MLGAGALGSCSEDVDDTDFNDVEQEILDLWMTDNADLLTNKYPDLCSNRMKEGYYVQIIEDKTGDESAGAVAQPGGWVKYNITSTDLDGNICNNRSETMAVQQGKFNYYTRYVPFTDYIPNQHKFETAANEAIEYLLQSEELELSVQGVKQLVQFRAGSEFVIYMPSDLAGVVNGVGGFAGQTSLSGFRPMISKITITEVMDSSYEGDVMVCEKESIDNFTKDNSTIGEWKWLDDDSADYIFLCEDYDPIGKDHRLDFGADFYPYTKLLRDRKEHSGDEPNSSYNLVEAINDEFYAILENDEYNSFSEDADGEEVGDEGTAYIWYIVRTLDGFIVDTNIADVQRKMYDTTTTNTTLLQYDVENSQSSYISAWSHVIPKLKYGSWSAFVTSSGNAYGRSGTKGSATSTEIPPYTPLVFEIFVKNI